MIDTYYILYRGGNGRRLGHALKHSSSTRVNDQDSIWTFDLYGHKPVRGVVPILLKKLEYSLKNKPIHDLKTS